jgi:hypothetical protein
MHRGGRYTRILEPHGPAFQSVSLDPNPVIEAYKKDVDRTLLRENLRLTTTERVRKMIAALRFAEAVRRSRVKADAT